MIFGRRPVPAGGGLVDGRHAVAEAHRVDAWWMFAPVTPGLLGAGPGDAD